MFGSFPLLFSFASRFPKYLDTCHGVTTVSQVKKIQEENSIVRADNLSLLGGISYMKQVELNTQGGTS